MNGFMTVAIAHDATCEPGEEWLFPGMADPKGDGFTDWEPSTGCCIMVLGFVVFVVGFVIWAIWRLI